jgi:ATP-dependent Lon protease
MAGTDAFRIPPEQLRWTLDPETLGLETTDDVSAMPLTPGQERAVRALDIGLGLRSQGYNVFLAGDAGTHRAETLAQLFKRLDHADYTPEDFCFVHNFRQPDLPRLLRFPGGMGCTFRKAMEEVVTRLRQGIPRLLGSEVYAKRRKARVKRYAARMEQLAQPLRDKADPERLALVQVQIGDRSDAELLPIVDGEPVAFEDLEAMVEKDEFSKQELQRLVKARETLLMDLRTFSEAADAMAAEATEDLSGLDLEMIRPHLHTVLGAVNSRFQQMEGVNAYLHEVEEFLQSRIKIFRRSESEDEYDEEEARETYRRLTVNLVLDNEDVEERPIIHEPSPSVANLRGTIDREVRSGGRVISDFSHIKAGSILRAHGGFLILHADDLEGEGHGAWNLIKRTLRTQELRIELEGSDQAGPRAIRPEPIPVDVKIIIIGTNDLYQALLDADPDFPKLFKIKAEFDSEMELSPQSLQEYARLVRGVCDADGLPAFGADGVGALVEYGVRVAGQRNRITTRFTKIEDLVRESAFWARKRGTQLIGAQDVHRALEERRHRVNLFEERTQRIIREGVIIIETEGGTLGQINGLTVLDLGNHTFGRPTRITASVAAGTGGIVNIERRVALSGSYHDKGHLILTGFLTETFADRHPLAVSASITLEQSYSEIDGDSATLAEVLVLLSSLSRIPIRQDVAVTGSMDQKGRVQPVGGLNEKVEGFFDLCHARGLTGTQGVLIPQTNLPNLMLRPDVVDAVREERFAVHAVSRIEEAVEIMTGVPAGERGSGGTYAPDSVFGRVAARLEELAHIARDYTPWSSSD